MHLHPSLLLHVNISCWSKWNRPCDSQFRLTLGNSLKQGFHFVGTTMASKCPKCDKTVYFGKWQQCVFLFIIVSLTGLNASDHCGGQGWKPMTDCTLAHEKAISWQVEHGLAYQANLTDDRVQFTDRCSFWSSPGNVNLLRHAFKQKRFVDVVALTPQQLCRLLRWHCSFSAEVHFWVG